MVELETQWLEGIRRNIEKSLFCIEDWARRKEREYSDDEVFEAVADRFNYGYMSRTSDGWIYMEDDPTDEYDKEQEDMKVNKLGHLFTFNRSEFWHHCRNALDELRRDIIAFSVRQPQSQSEIDFNIGDFEAAYFAHASVAWAWQECYSDDDDEDDLLKLLRLLRRLVEL